MALPSSGTITINQIATEFGCAKNLSACAAAAGVSSSGGISMSEFYGLSSFRVDAVMVSRTRTTSTGYSVNFFGEGALGSLTPSEFNGVWWLAMFDQSGKIYFIKQGGNHGGANTGWTTLSFRNQSSGALRTYTRTSMSFDDADYAKYGWVRWVQTTSAYFVNGQSYDVYMT